MLHLKWFEFPSLERLLLKNFIGAIILEFFAQKFWAKTNYDEQDSTTCVLFVSFLTSNKTIASESLPLIPISFALIEAPGHRSPPTNHLQSQVFDMFFSKVILVRTKNLSHKQNFLFYGHPRMLLTILLSQINFSKLYS